MNDELETLTDAELSELFALEVAGMTKRTEGLFWSADDKRAYILTGSALHDVRKKMRLPCTPDLMLSFATDANAVLPFLEKLKKFHIYWDDFRMPAIPLPSSYHIDIRGRRLAANVPTLARAICLALVRAKRAAKGGA